MSLIITATDFSIVAENAAIYACELANRQQADLVVIHSYMVPAMFSDIPMPPTMINEAQRDSEEQMALLVMKLKAQFPGLGITGTVIYGDLIDAIGGYADERPGAWMVVVGNSSLDEGGWPDSNLLAALTKLECPVLAVPSGAVFRPVKRICFAFDNKHTGNEKPIDTLQQIVQTLGAALYVLHAQLGEEGSDVHTEIDSRVVAQLASVQPAYHVQGGVGDAEEAIQQFVDGNNIDWVIVIPRKHSFFEGLFHRSQTRAVVSHMHIPILALPDAAEQ